jgi:hypothetical protein
MTQPLPRRADGKVEVFHAVTGQREVRWPVDARDMLRDGSYVLDFIKGRAEAEPPVVTPATTTAPVVTEDSPTAPDFAAMSRAELVAHAESLGLTVDAKANKAQIIAQITAHQTGG